MPVSASWHATLAVPTTDPFEIPERIEDVGVPISLSADGRQAELRVELLATVEQEVRLSDAGVRCRIKGTQGVSCHACTLFNADDELCNVGRRQELIITELRVNQLGGRRQ